MSRSLSRHLPIETLERRSLLSSVFPMSANPGDALVGVAGADQAMVFASKSNKKIKLFSLSADGRKATELPIRAAKASAGEVLNGGLYFVAAANTTDSPIAVTDGTVAGTRYVSIELNSSTVTIERIDNVNGLLVAIGSDVGASDATPIFAFDAAKRRFRYLPPAARRYDLADAGLGDRAGTIGGQWRIADRSTGRLYALHFPRNGTPSFQKKFTLPQSPGDRANVFDLAFKDGSLYYTRRDGNAATGTWISDGTATGSKKLSATAVSFADAQVIGQTRYAFDDQSLWSHDLSGDAIARLADLPDVSGQMFATSERLFWVDADGVVTMKPSDSVETRAVNLRGTLPRVDSVDAATTDRGFLILRVSSSATGGEILVTDGRSTQTRVFDLMPGATSSGASFVSGAGGRVMIRAQTVAGVNTYQLKTTTGASMPAVTYSRSIGTSEGKTIALGVSNMTDAEADTPMFQWDVNGDGDYGDLVTFSTQGSLAWNTLKDLAMADGPATFKGRVRVSDLEHTWVSAPISFRIADAIPVVTASFPSDVRAQTNYDITFNFTDAGNDVVTAATIDWGDGSADSLAISIGAGAWRANHTYASPGAYAVKATVTDGDGVHELAAVNVQVVKRQSGTILMGEIYGDGLEIGENAGLLDDDLLIYESIDSTGAPSISYTKTTAAEGRVLIPGRTLASTLRVGSKLFMIVGADAYEQKSLWVTDGTGKRTVQLWDNVYDSYLEVVDGRVAFRGVRTENEYNDDVTNLMFTDGTVAGTYRVRTPQNKYIDYFCSEPVRFEGETYFLAQSTVVNDIALFRLAGDDAIEVVTLDGAEADAADLYANENAITIVGIYSGGRVWLSDGTQAGTREVPTVNTSVSSRFRASDTFVGTRFGYHAATDSESTFGLYATSSPVTTLRPLVTFDRSEYGSSMTFVGERKGITFFVVDHVDDNGQLWRTDGTVAGTYQVTPVWVDFSAIGWVFDDDYLYFFGSDLPAEDRFGGDPDPASLYRTDGTQSGTIRLDASARNYVYIGNLIPQPDGSGVEFAEPNGSSLSVYQVDGKTPGVSRFAQIENLPAGETYIDYAILSRAADTWFVTSFTDPIDFGKTTLWSILT